MTPLQKKRKNLGTFSTCEAAEKHEREVQYFVTTREARKDTRYIRVRVVPYCALAEVK